MEEKLVFVKTKSTDPFSCGKCEIATKSDHCYIYNNKKCDSGYHYKLSEEEPKGIQSEYEWKKERLDAISRGPFIEEGLRLTKWLIENKPEQWETCTKENTKVGDVVRLQNSTYLRIIAFIYENGEDCIVTYLNSEGNKVRANEQSDRHFLYNYEIDINNKQGK